MYSDTTWAIDFTSFLDTLHNYIDGVEVALNGIWYEKMRKSYMPGFPLHITSHTYKFKPGTYSFHLLWSFGKCFNSVICF